MTVTLAFALLGIILFTNLLTTIRVVWTERHNSST